MGAKRRTPSPDDDSHKWPSTAWARSLITAAVDEQPAAITTAIALSVLEARERCAPALDRGAKQAANSPVQAPNLDRREGVRPPLGVDSGLEK